LATDAKKPLGLSSFSFIAISNQLGTWIRTADICPSPADSWNQEILTRCPDREHRLTAFHRRRHCRSDCDSNA
jgi:hypothetical protein